MSWLHGLLFICLFAHTHQLRGWRLCEHKPAGLDRFIHGHFCNSNLELVVLADAMYGNLSGIWYWIGGIPVAIVNVRTYFAVRSVDLDFGHMQVRAIEPNLARDFPISGGRR